MISDAKPDGSPILQEVERVSRLVDPEEVADVRATDLFDSVNMTKETVKPSI